MIKRKFVVYVRFMVSVDCSNDVIGLRLYFHLSMLIKLVL